MNKELRSVMPQCKCGPRIKQWESIRHKVHTTTEYTGVTRWQKAFTETTYKGWRIRHI